MLFLALYRISWRIGLTYANSPGLFPITYNHWYLCKKKNFLPRYTFGICCILPNTLLNNPEEYRAILHKLHFLNGLISVPLKWDELNN